MGFQGHNYNTTVRVVAIDETVIQKSERGGLLANSIISKQIAFLAIVL